MREVLHQHASRMKVTSHPIIVIVSWYFYDMKWNPKLLRAGQNYASLLHGIIPEEVRLQLWVLLVTC